MRMIIALGAMLLVLSTAAADVFHWKRPAADPYICKECTPEMALELLKIPEPLKTRALREIESGRSQLVEVGCGERYDGMSGGRNRPKVVWNVVTAYDCGIKLKARRYQAEAGSQKLTLDRFEICNNWASRLEVRAFPALPPPISIPAPAGPPWGRGVLDATCPDGKCNDCS